jgi:hypothetical protein
MKKCTFFILLSFFLKITAVEGQHEFLVTVNSATGTDSGMDSLNGVNYIYQGATTFDMIHHRYFFGGTDFKGFHHLYDINAISSSIITQPYFAIAGSVGELHYDNTTNVLYGLYMNNSLGKLLLISIDTSSAFISVIDTLPVVGFSSGTTFFDEANQVYVLQNSGTFYSVNVISGKITASSATVSFNGLEFNNASGVPYGLVITSTPQMLLVSINVSGGTYTIIDTLPTVGVNFATFNENSHVYTFCNNANHLYSVDVNTGKIIASPVFPVGITPPQNVIELHYDNSNSILYALHWGNIDSLNGINELKTNYGGISLYPNPNNGVFQLAIRNEQFGIKNSVEVYNMLGEKVYQQHSIPNSPFSINLSGQPSGVYLYRVITDSGTEVGEGKFIIQ